MSKLILKSSNLIALNDSENINLGELKFDISQFKVPSAMVVPKGGFTSRIVRERNANGELVETGELIFSFQVYDRAFIEMVLGNGSTEVGSPITVVVENQDESSEPNFDSFEDGEFVPITFKGLHVKPRRVQKKVFVGDRKPMADTWQYAEIKVEAESYTIGEVNEPKAK